MPYDRRDKYEPYQPPQQGRPVYTHQAFTNASQELRRELVLARLKKEEREELIKQGRFF